MQVEVARGERITPEHIAGRAVGARRVLFRTGTFPDPRRWNDDFASLSPSLVDSLRERGVILIGIDTPSVDPFDSKALEAHHAFARNDMAILEGLVLDAVPEGEYELIAPPLRLRGGDASPVRAVLRTL
jgi:arylformamidase